MARQVSAAPAGDGFVAIAAGGSHTLALRGDGTIASWGSDGAGKQELDARIYEKTDLAVVDSVPQCVLLGESHYAIEAGIIAEAALVELGAIISGNAAGRHNDEQITVADLTGVAVQDIQIAKSILLKLQ